MKNEITGMKLRLIVMNFLQFAVWGAYLTSMGTYLFNIGLGARIGLFYAMQGIVSLFMPAVMGIIADRWVPAQKLYGFCHFMAAVFMVAAGWYGYVDGEAVNFSTLFTFYSFSVAFYMPTLALTNSVAYTALDKVKLDPVIAFPPIRIFGTIGFICSMLLTDILGFQNNYMQFFSCACFGVILAIYALTLPECPVSRGGEQKSLVDAMGLRAFTLFKQKKMAVFFIFSMLLGVSLQITNGFANPFLSSFRGVPEYADTFGVNHANALISLSQVSETLCILLIPFVLKHFGIMDGDAPLLLHHHQVLVLIADGQGAGNRRNLIAPRHVPHRHREKLSRPSCLVGEHRLPVQQNAVRQGLGPPDTGGGQQKLLPEQGVNGPPRLGLSQAQGQTAHRQTSSLFSGVAAFFVVHFPYDSIPKEVIR